MENSLNLGSRINTTGSINKLVSNINQTCDALLGALEFTTGGVSSYSTKITENVMNSEFVDRVVNNILLLKGHLNDIKKHAYSLELSIKEVEELTTNLLETSDKLTSLMQENIYFNDTFGYLVQEITRKIPQVINKIPIKTAIAA